MSEITGKLTTALADRYKIERHLGEGGMANVYLAKDLKHERKVAVKVLRPELAAVLGAERFIQEIKTTANLQHPHILPLHDSGEQTLFDASGFQSNPTERWYDVAPDDQRFVMVQPGASTSALMMVVNWLEELKTTLGR